MSVDWRDAAKKLYGLMPDGCNSLTATAELDDGFSQIGFICTREGDKKEVIFVDPLQSSELSSSLLKIRHELGEQTGDKITGCEITVNSNKSFKYHLKY